MKKIHIETQNGKETRQSNKVKGTLREQKHKT